jgi:CRP-like cAMP-binding protein
VCVREGEEADNLYVIQSGVFEAFKGSGAAEKVVFTYKEAGAFGELALLYNCSRAASVRVGALHAEH